MKNFLQQLISDGEQPSTYRVAMLLVIAPVMIVWMVLSIKRGEFLALDWQIISLLATAFGGKVLQSFSERQTPTPIPEPRTSNSELPTPLS